MSTSEFHAATAEFLKNPPKPGSPWYGAEMPEPERIIQTSPANADQAVARAIAKAAVLGESWRVEIVG